MPFDMPLTAHSAFLLQMPSSTMKTQVHCPLFVATPLKQHHFVSTLPVQKLGWQSVGARGGGRP